jgi:hypothetical protein
MRESMKDKNNFLVTKLGKGSAEQEGQCHGNYAREIKGQKRVKC